jgi:hypothetical protein
MVPGMGDKICVLMGFSLIQKIVVEKIAATLFTKNTFCLKQASLALYLKKNLMSSQDINRQNQQKIKGMPMCGLFSTAIVGEIQ